MVLILTLYVPPGGPIVNKLLLRSLQRLPKTNGKIIML